MKVLKQILPHWSISVALIAVLIASSSIISTTNKSVMTVHASTTTTQAKAPVIKPGALVSEIVKVDVIDSKGNKITFSAIKGSTLEAAMKLAKVTVPTTDELPMPLSTVLENDMSVVLTATNETVKNKNIRFKTVEKEDDSLAEGKTKVAQKGEQGKKEMTYETVVANNTVQSTKKISETTVQEPVDKIVLVGTKVKETKKVKEVVATKTEKLVAEKEEKATETVETKAEAPAAATSGRTMQVEATAYTGGGITATGINLNDNSKVIAVDPSVIPLGSRVLIDGYGEYIAGDTGGAINGNIIDVYVASHSEAISFGRRALTIHVLN
ncbi:3D domain-containing protein [Brochothrix thermosphacta]|uniref:G5 and 3D domain-containing protein n=1 Tax=Brochothrix thermosphacta TaxID=2756 RepID=UPI0039AF7AE1